MPKSREKSTFAGDRQENIEVRGAPKYRLTSPRAEKYMKPLGWPDPQERFLGSILVSESVQSLRWGFLQTGTREGLKGNQCGPMMTQEASGCFDTG